MAKKNKSFTKQLDDCIYGRRKLLHFAWSTPMVAVIALPAHAQMSPPEPPEPPEPESCSVCACTIPGYSNGFGAFNAMNYDGATCDLSGFANIDTFMRTDNNGGGLNFRNPQLGTSNWATTLADTTVGGSAISETRDFTFTIENNNDGSVFEVCFTATYDDAARVGTLTDICIADPIVV